MDKTKNRIHLLDELRGFAIIAMIIHHTFYDIGFLFNSSWATKLFNDLCIIQPIFLMIFIVISGICTQLSRSSIKRGIIVFCCGIAITLVTCIIMPLMGLIGADIIFGILSFIGTSMIIVGLLKKPIEKTNAKVGVIISLLLYIITFSVEKHSLLFGLIKLPDALYKTDILFPLGFYSAKFFSADYFPLLPWFFVFLFGVFIGKYAKQNKFPQFTYNKHSKFLSFVGRNSLWFYLAHQPIIYAICFITKFIISKIQ